VRSRAHEVRTAAAKLGGEGAQVVVAYEAGHEGFWIQRDLVERGFQAEVIDPVSLKVDRRSKRAKTDRLDAEALTRALYDKYGCARCPPVVPLCCAGARLGAGPGRSLHPRAPMRISP
jgi:transposase